MKYELKDFYNAAAFSVQLANEEKSGQLANIAELILWAADTIYMPPGSGMRSWEESLQMEYMQLEERVRRLGHVLENWESGIYKGRCPRGMLEEQLQAMLDYKDCLRKRAKMDEVEMPKTINWRAQG